MKSRSKAKLVLLAATSLAASQASAAIVTLTNGIPSGTLGSFTVNMGAGGDVPGNQVGGAGASITAKEGDGTLTTDSSLIYDYTGYFNIGNGGVEMAGTSTSGPTAVGTNGATSAGSFTGSAGNTINWVANTTLPVNGVAATTTYTFTAATGSLGTLGFTQYLDEDVAQSPGNDDFFTKGTAATGDLQLFTVDSNLLYGLSHSGAYSTSEGLVNSSFVGFAVNQYDSMRPLITGNTQTWSPTGVFAAGLPTTTIPVVGAGYGPFDIVSSLDWSVDPNASSATIIASLGGLPDINNIPTSPTAPPPPASPPSAVPLPAAAWPGLSMLAGLSLLKFRRTQKLAK